MINEYSKHCKWWFSQILARTIFGEGNRKKKNRNEGGGIQRHAGVPLPRNPKVAKGRGVLSHHKLGAKLKMYFSSNDEGAQNKAPICHASSRGIKI